MPPSPAFEAEHSDQSQPFKIGYARVSMRDQNPQLQIDALKAAGCNRIYVEEKSGASIKNRAEYHAMMTEARSGDVVVVWKLDRLGRNTQEVLATFDELTKKGVQVMVLMNRELDTTTPTGRLMITILAAVAQIEREFTVERTKAGRFGGRVSQVSDEKIEAAWNELGASGAAKKLKLSRVQIIKRMNRIRDINAGKAAFKLNDEGDPISGK
jgi:DNA invertase Pin-like site-specific DNA recombinase